MYLIYNITEENKVFHIKRQKLKVKNNPEADIVLETFTTIEEARLGLEKYYPNMGNPVYIQYSQEELGSISR